MYGKEKETSQLLSGVSGGSGRLERKWHSQRKMGKRKGKGGSEPGDTGKGWLGTPELINEGQAPIHVCEECLTMSFPWACHHLPSCSPAQPAQELIQSPVKLLGINTDSVLIALHCLEFKTSSPNSVFTTSRIESFELK